MQILTQAILDDLVSQGYTYAALEDFIDKDGRSVMVIRPLMKFDRAKSLSHSVTLLTDPMITTSLESGSTLVEIIL